MTHRCYFLHGLAALALTVGAGGAGRAQSLKTESGRLQTLIARLAGSDYVIDEQAKDKRPYVDPSPVLNNFRHMAAAMAWGDVKIAAREAAKLDYELIEFTDSQTKKEYYVLREDRNSDR